MAHSLPSPPRKSRHPSRNRGSSQKIVRLRSKSNFGKNLLLYQFGVRYSIDDDGIADRHAHCSVCG
jgi:hypothetical protein